MTRSPFITVITATHNARQHFARTVQSLRDQTYRDFEWIVIDGASTDGTVDLIRGQESTIAAWTSEPDRGIYDAWNKGLRLARGRWICFLGADDWLWDFSVLARMAVILEKAHPPFRVVYGKVARVNPAGEILSMSGSPWEKVRQRFQSVMSLPQPGLMHHRSLFEEHGNFDPTFRIAGDYELLLRELRTRNALFAGDIVTAGMSTEGVSSNPEMLGLSLREVRRATRKNGRLFPGMPWLLAIVRHFGRRLLWFGLGEPAAREVLDACRRILGKPAYWTRTNRQGSGQ